MTLGDRVAVLKQGVVQQIGTPTELYAQPSNLFVASFIGSPAMNFFPAEFKGGRLFFPLLDADIAAPKKAHIPHGMNNLIVGLRPEHFTVLDNINQQSENQVAFDIAVDVAEWLGADILVYFQKEVSHWPNSPALEHDLNLKKRSGGTLDFAVRLNSALSVKANETIKLIFDANDLHLFDPETGDCFTSMRD